MHIQNADFRQFIYECSPIHLGGTGRGRGLGCLEGEIVSLHHLYKVQLSNFTVVICGKSLTNWVISHDISGSVSGLRFDTGQHVTHKSSC